MAEHGGRAGWLAPAGGGTAHASPPHPAAVVPGQRLLEAAATLADGATEVHAQLRDIGPGGSDELLEILTRQLNAIVAAWVGLVRDMLVQDAPGSAAQAPPAVGTEAPAGPPATTDRPAGGADTEPRRAAGAKGEPPPAPSGAGPDAGLREGAGDSYHLDVRSRDELTGLLDRPAGFAAVRRQMERARRLGEPIVVGYLDVNALRRVNDTRGIRAGDDLLRSIGASLRTVLREHDVVARVGGDKFVFAMAGVELDRARERFVTFVVAPEESAPPSRIVRIGFAQLRDEDAVEDLVARAEAAIPKPAP
jgi:diguanylate cyclase (GGDEF)-like protein